MTVNEVRERIYNGECLSDMFEFTDGQDCIIYKGDWNPDDDVIYIPDIDLNEICINRPLINILTSGEIIDVLGCLYTGKDFMELTDRDEDLAKELFNYVDWQHPSSALNEVLDDDEQDYEDEREEERISHYGEIKFNGDCFILKEREECNNPEWMYLCDLFSLDYEATEQIVIDGIVKYFGLRKGE